VRGAFPTEKDITLRAVEDLEYLKAVIQENFRMAPPVPGQVPRIVVKGENMICGRFIPENTFVGVPQYPAYRSAINFAYPENFLPERWLETTSPLFAPSDSDPGFDASSFLADKHAVLQPFSVGPRNCIGRILAHAEIRLILCRLLWKFDLQIPEDKVLAESITKPWDDQKTYALWERRPRWVRMVRVQRSEI